MTAFVSQRGGEGCTKTWHRVRTVLEVQTWGPGIASASYARRQATVWGRQTRSERDPGLQEGLDGGHDCQPLRPIFGQDRKHEPGKPAFDRLFVAPSKAGAAKGADGGEHGGDRPEDGGGKQCVGQGQGQGLVHVEHRALGPVEAPGRAGTGHEDARGVLQGTVLCHDLVDVLVRPVHPRGGPRPIGTDDQQLAGHREAAHGQAHVPQLVLMREGELCVVGGLLPPPVGHREVRPPRQPLPDDGHDAEEHLHVLLHLRRLGRGLVRGRHEALRVPALELVLRRRSRVRHCLCL
mmetsp:Transcript_82985/g.138530  ORF Transcript_82985/g.138530 Transcript_82985/m.138530 type:complete len:293 (-) Transcript_82985:18-896(-)